MAASIANTRQSEIQKCRLLDLPAELRNRVYHFAREENQIGFVSRRLKKYDDSELVARSITIAQPEYLSLTQVCRQFRAEYSPVYAAATRVHACHIDLKEFSDRGFPQLACDKDANIVGNLCIDFTNSPSGKDDWLFDYSAVDIRPFLQKCKRFPGLRIEAGFHGCTCTECQNTWSGIQDNLEVLLNLSDNRKLQAWVDDAVTEIGICFESGLRFCIKQGKLQKWMKDTHKASRDPLYLNWAQETGLKVAESPTRGVLVFEES